MSRSVIAVDVGGTTIKGAVVDATGRTACDRSRPTRADQGSDAVVAQLLALISDLRAQRDGVEAVGVVVPGVVDTIAGVASFAANLGFRDLPLRSIVQEASGLPVVLGHDVQAAGVAERTVGLTTGVADSFTAVLGTGIAAMVHAAGVDVAGARALAGEFGHIPVWPEGEQCPCGQRGCLERYASAASIARRYRERSGDAAATAADVAARRSADELARAAWHDATEALAIGLATVTMLLDPALIVLAGGLSQAGEALLAPVEAGLAARVVWRPPPPVRLSSLGGRAGLVGAAVLVWRSLGIDRFDAWSAARSTEGP